MAKKIFISVGSRFAMNRLLLSVDNFIQKRPGFEAVAQIGSSEFQTNNITSKLWLCPKQFKEELIRCDIFISHAGMGNILLAAELNKPIIIMPRKADLGEHINNHQLGTAEGFREHDFIYIANDQAELEESILEVVTRLDNGLTFNGDASVNNTRNELINFVGNFLNNNIATK